MLNKRKLFGLFLVFFLIFVFIIHYFMSILAKTESEVRITQDESVEAKILNELHNLSKDYYQRTIKYDHIIETFRKNLAIKQNKKNYLHLLWKEVNDSINKTNLYFYEQNNLGHVVNVLNSGNIIKADLDTRGTQLKLLLTLEGNQTVVFKPKWYEIDRIIEGPVYAGKDRFGSEVVAFYLSAILNKPLVPISTIRQINVKEEILPVATRQLLKTSFNYKNSTCIYGQCYYCKKEDPICDLNGYITGTVIFNLENNLKSYRSPWQRTYKKNKKALWETENNYCRSLAGKLTKQRLYDLIDTSIFDFLIQNGDRHHYETLNDRVIWIDNGKGLGNPNTHFIDILAPLYQCCMLRNDTWNRLQSLSGGLLIEHMLKMPNIEKIITKSHLNAMEDRLLIIFATVEYCRNRNKINNFN